jgi:hypothetical protein
VTRGVGVGLALLCASLLEAQEGSVVVGGSRSRFGDSLAGTAVFAAGRLSVDRGLSAGEFAAAFSAFVDGGWALQVSGQATALWRARRAGGLYLGFAGGGALNAYDGGTPSGVVAGGPLAALTVGPATVSLGAAGGTLRRVDSTWAPMVSASARWQWASGRGLAVDAGATLTATDSNRLADFSAGLRLQASSLRLALAAGTRVGDLSDGAWGSVDLAWQLTPVVTLEASAGRFARDLVGFAHGLYVQGGVRVTTPVIGRSRHRPVLVTPLGDGRVRIALRYGHAATSLAIVGDWNGWTPVPLRREREWWIAELTVPRGIHHYAIIADGVWTLPDGVTRIADEFGGQVAPLIVRDRP